MDNKNNKIESFFKLREDKNNSDLSLKELFSMLEQVESLTLPTLNVKAAKTSSEEQLFKAINNRLAKIIGENNSIEVKFQNLQIYLEQLKKQENSIVFNFNEALAVIITINSLFKMIQSYTPQVAGKLFEYFIELIFGGKVQIDQNQLVDIVINNENWSLKLLSKPEVGQRYGVQGSIKQAIDFFAGDETKKIKYLIAFKNETDTLAFYVVELNLEKFDTFLKDPDINKTASDKQFNFNKEKFIEDSQQIASLTLSQQDVDYITKNNEKIFTNQINTVLNELKDLKEITTTYFVSNRAEDGSAALTKSENVTNNLRQITTGKIIK